MDIYLNKHLVNFPTCMVHVVEYQDVYRLNYMAHPLLILIMHDLLQDDLYINITHKLNGQNCGKHPIIS